MKHKVGDKVRIKSKDWYERNKDKNGNITLSSGNHFGECMKELLGKSFTISAAESGWYNLKGSMYRITDEMIDDSYTQEKSILSEEMIKDIAEVVKKHNLGVSISENDGKLIIDPLKVEKEEELEKGTYVMVTNDINNEFWTLRQYLCDGYCDTYRTESFNIPQMKFKYIIEFSKFNPNNIEESLKYNIVK